MIEKEAQGRLTYKEAIGVETSQQDYYQTQYKMLKSRDLARRVIDELSLKSLAEFSDKKDNISFYLKHISVDPVRGTRLVDLSAEYYDPSLASRIANAHATTESIKVENIVTMTKAVVEIIKIAADANESK